MTAKRDGSVYQHLLRELRNQAAASFGMNGRDSGPLEILHAAVAQALMELEVVSEALERTLPPSSPILGTVPAIAQRLSFALELGEGLYDPDHPFRTASAAEYHPDGVMAGLAADRATGGES